MSQVSVFIQIQGCKGITEAKVPAAATIDELRSAITGAGVALDGNSVIFIDDADQPLEGNGKKPVPGLKNGSRVHVTRCKRIHTTVHFAEKTFEGDFAPGVRLRVVKLAAVHEFKMDPKDAAEHVLQLCNSTRRPSSDTPLQELAQDGCQICFDLVPEKRVEGCSWSPRAHRTVFCSNIFSPQRTSAAARSRGVGGTSRPLGRTS
jgi:hypothetical protein